MVWQRDEMRMFIHFGPNTYTSKEWGDGAENPSVFNPTHLNTRQWARTAREAGFKTLILTAKHHDGFCLWPSRYTAHTVMGSPWRSGRGDVLRELSEAVRSEGLKLGVYLSPWDQHEPAYGDNGAYNTFYMGQLTELLTGYGPLAEVWFDGAKGKDAKDMVYDFDAYFALVRQHQPDAVIFNGPDVRWIGNEKGFAGETNWSTFDPAKFEIGVREDGAYLASGEPGGPVWRPGECDVSIRPGWFWHPDEDPKTLDELMEIYYKSVGRNCLLLLNVPPDPTGRFEEKDVRRLHEMAGEIRRIFSVSLAARARAESESVRGNSPLYAASRVLDENDETYWATDDEVRSASLQLDLDGTRTFDVIRLQEPVGLGQRVKAYHVEAWIGEEWKTISSGTTIGYKKLDRLRDPVTTGRVRIVIDDARANPLLAEVGLHYDGRPTTRF